MTTDLPLLLALQSTAHEGAFGAAVRLAHVVPECGSTQDETPFLDVALDVVETV